MPKFWMCSFSALFRADHRIDHRGVNLWPLGGIVPPAAAGEPGAKAARRAIYFRCLMLDCFEGIDSERGIA